MLDIDYPEQLNAASLLVDAHLDAGRGDKTAILCGNHAVSYRQLHEAVNRVGNVLRRLGVRMEDRVAILLPDMPEWIMAFFGAMKIGAVAVPLNTLLKPAEYEYLLNDCRARVLIVHPAWHGPITKIRERLTYLEHVVVAGNEISSGLPLHSLMEQAGDVLEAAKTSRDDAAFWLYSSGTTGFPKAAIHLHHDMLVEADQYAGRVLGLHESDVSFSVAKLFFAYGLGNGLYFPLRFGGTTVLLPDRPLPERVFQTIDRYQPTVFYSVPTSYVALLQQAEETGRTSLGRVRMCVSAGEPLPEHTFLKWRERFGVEILDGIGSTEILHIYISNRPGAARAGSTGQLVPGYQGRIVDDLGTELPVGEVGTLWIKGDSTATGYWNNHEQTKQTFCGEWINTKDKFRQDKDGYFWYAGRRDDMMKVGGQAVWPADVEAILLTHPDVLESAVIGAVDHNGLTKPVAYVILKNGRPRNGELAKELQEFVKDATAPCKYPRAVVFVDSLPKTATGKIQRFLLRERAAREALLERG